MTTEETKRDEKPAKSARPRGVFLQGESVSRWIKTCDNVSRGFYPDAPVIAVIKLDVNAIFIPSIKMQVDSKNKKINFFQF